MSTGPLSDEERRDWLRLSRTETVGPSTFRALLERFGSASEALRELPGLVHKSGLGRAPRIFPRDEAQRALDNAATVGARFIAWVEADYPALLRQIDSAPPVICVKGDAGLLSRSGAAIVGARNASAIARKFARQLAREIGAEGHVIMSGLARGIDTAAHEAALETGTVAVVAGGVDVVYPPENAALHAALGERGAIVSEQLPGAEPKAEFFPRRNRIISGLSRAVIVIEAALRSGSLITARLAAEQGREVFAVPGFPLDPRCEGTNRLIRDGAALLMSSRDVLDALAEGGQPRQMSFLEPEPSAIVPPPPASEAHETLLELLSPTPIGADELIRESGLDPPTFSALLLDLVLAGRVTRHANGAVSLA